MKLTFTEYYERIIKYAKPQASTIVCSIILLERFCIRRKFYLEKSNIFKLFLVSTVVSIKLNEDLIFKNDFYAKVGGVSLEKFNLLEESFIQLLNFELNVNFKTFESYIKMLIEN